MSKGDEGKKEQEQEFRFVCGCKVAYPSENQYWGWTTGQCETCDKECCWQCGEGQDFSSSPEGFMPDIHVWCMHCSANNYHAYESYGQYHG